MGRFKTLLSNSVVFTLSNFASKVLGFLMLPLYTRVLSKEEFGNADIVIFSIGLLMPVLTFSIIESILRFSIDEKYNKTEVFTVGINIIFVGCIFLIGLYPVFVYIDLFKSYVIWFYLVYFAQMCNLYFNYFVRGLGSIRLIGLVSVIQSAMLVGCNFMLLVHWDYGVNGLFISIILSNFVAAFILFLTKKLYKFYSLQLVNPFLKREILRYSIPLIPTRTSWWITNSSNRYLVASSLSMSDVGVLAAASKIPSILSTFQGVFIQAWEVSALVEYGKKDSKKFFTDIYKGYNFVLVSGASIMISFNDFLCDFLLGERFIEGRIIVPFMEIAVVFGGLIGFLNTINMAVKKTSMLVLPVLFGALFGVTLNMLFLVEFGVIVTGFSFLLSYILIWALRLYNSFKYMRLEIHLLSDIVSYVLIIGQAVVIVYFDGAWVSFISLSVLIVLMLVNRLILKKSVVVAFSLIRKQLNS